ncbi:alpha/beta hydrolase [Phenylobacterium sp.]|uniref:alpha/beta fold hydrolase n=1 Tax=Phenylobacterium sp. TaxID=1871053 RepID=UPI00301C1E02
MRRLSLAALAGAAAVGLSGCLAGDIPYATLETRYASPASRYTDLPGGLRVHYRDEGPRDAARTLVLIHGFSASVHAWEPWVERLSNEYRIVTLDLPGHGLTRAPNDYVASTSANVGIVDELTRRLGLTRFVVGGNSMGGGVAWNYALAHPDRLDGLVLVGSAGWPDAERSREGSPLVFRLLANPAGRALLRNVDPGLFAEKGLKQAYLDESLVTDAVVGRYVDLARAPGHRAILTRDRAPAPQVTPQTFAAIRTPTLVMTGEQDALIPAAHSRGLAGAIAGAKLIVYPDGGHVPMEQLPDRSAADLRAFLAALPG